MFTPVRLNDINDAELKFLDDQNEIITFNEITQETSICYVKKVRSFTYDPLEFNVDYKNSALIH